MRQNRWKKAIASLLIVISCTLAACGGVGSLQGYSNGTYGYQFLYPNGWIPVDVSKSDTGVDVVFRDLVEYSENLSVIISDVPADKALNDLGTPTDVGYRFMKEASQNSDRQPELIRAESRTDKGQTYYTLEYRVTLPEGQMRHDLATVAVKLGKLYTFNLSTRESRWPQVEKLFNAMVNSFKV
ncbi:MULTISPECIES: photosystem II reaction center PsbP [Cyanophyceae]|uniref:photosystem II reaction center PsbP n=1 Tax=Cyanophyceae TaxID=3028117 RepID=UPI00016DCA49|nr:MULTISPECIES: photosystem II reaction center PsbP [Cyanophyceae]ACA99300.1 PsbP [Picosynechococcus sp. PCC 7002]AMA09029.1 photosystem II oxygen evolving complex protein PsbP [Picosynechococcus sp. PCC 73109]ANV90320.1 photosystem II oxygen evolving complex protein PsbP [Picosynechococcus sp. PCC 8807]QCS49872.1 photosystem II oxygen evolving complex protein PsbP [Picosynechococcus sp. PCC 11901]SMH32736.1 photosystem II oxygen-evolving enhancer protein 2 [Picosynechococcus sp. OG1]